jgi:hypothetical protein
MHAYINRFSDLCFGDAERDRALVEGCLIVEDCSLASTNIEEDGEQHSTFTYRNANITLPDP